MADERKCRYCGHTNLPNEFGDFVVGTTIGYECVRPTLCRDRCAEIIKDLEWDVEKRDEASQAMIELEGRLRKEIIELQRKEIIELQQLLKTSMSLLPDSDVAKARDVKVVVRKQEITALREVLFLSGEYVNHTRDCESHKSRIGHSMFPCDCGLASYVNSVAALLHPPAEANQGKGE